MHLFPLLLVGSVVRRKLTRSLALKNVNGVRAILPKRYLKLPSFFPEGGTQAISPHTGIDPCDDVILEISPR